MTLAVGWFGAERQGGAVGAGRQGGAVVEWRGGLAVWCRGCVAEADI